MATLPSAKLHAANRRRVRLLILPAYRRVSSHLRQRLPRALAPLFRRYAVLPPLDQTVIVRQGFRPPLKTPPDHLILKLPRSLFTGSVCILLWPIPFPT